VQEETAVPGNPAECREEKDPAEPTHLAETQKTYTATVTDVSVRVTGR
jgi:hypothetical protein